MLTNYQKNRIKSKTSPWSKHSSFKKSDMVVLYEKHMGKPLKRSGRALIGKCPFHEDRSPSFSIYIDTDSFYCFGCSASGDSSWFKRQIENL